jgi:hypothetical protein
MSHFGNSHNYYYKKECGHFSCEETEGSHHLVGTRHLPTNSVLNNRRSLVFGGEFKAHKKIKFKKLIVKLKMGRSETIINRIRR